MNRGTIGVNSLPKHVNQSHKTAAGYHYFSPDLQLPSQPLRGLLPILQLSEQMHNGCEQFTEDLYPTASRLRFEPGPSAPESSTLTTSVKILFAIFCTICGLCNSGFKWDKNDNDNNNRGKCMRGLCTRIVGEP